MSDKSENLYWACIDTTGRYMPELYPVRRDAEYHRRENYNIEDGRFVIRRVRLIEVKRLAKRKT